MSRSRTDLSLQIHSPRLSYLPFLLPRLHAFFASSLIQPDVLPYDAWFSFEGVPLKWHYPLGLLYDLFSGAEPATIERQTKGLEESQLVAKPAGQEEPLPWKLTVHYSDFPDEQLIQLDADGKMLLDAFINAVKEADFIRNGTARTVMSLSKEDSDNLWKAVQNRESQPAQIPTCTKINTKPHRRPPPLQHNPHQTPQSPRRNPPPHPAQNLPTHLRNPQHTLPHPRKNPTRPHPRCAISSPAPAALAPAANPRHRAQRHPTNNLPE